MAQADGYVLPNPAIPKTLGILNVIFAVILTLFGVCGIISLAALPSIQQFGAQATAKAKADDEAQKAAELKALDDRAAAATTDEEKKTIADERAAIAQRPSTVPAVTMDVTGLPTDSKTMAIYLGQTIWGLVLAIVLLVSGIGLIRLRGWGRKLCLTWAMLSIASTAGFTGFNLGFNGNANGVNEAQIAKLRDAAQAPNATPGDKTALQVAETMTRFTLLITLATVIAAITYPIICLALLNTARARAACLAPAAVSAFDPPLAGGYTLPPRS